MIAPALFALFDDRFCFLHDKKMKAFFFLSALMLFVSCEEDKSSSQSGMTSVQVQNETVVNEFMALVNTHRKEIGVSALVHVDEIALIAFDHSLAMARSEVSFGHSGFSSRCSQARQVMDGGNLCAENVARGQQTAEAVFLAWMNSTSHRANLENPRLTHTGLGLARASDGTPYWTQLFLEK